MGHKRLADLPNSGVWRRFKQALASDADASVAAAAAFDALSDHLPALADDPGLGHSFWVLTQLVWLSRSDNYLDELLHKEVVDASVTPASSAAELLSAVAAALQTALDRDPNATAFSDIAQLALRETLTRSIGREAQGLFGSSATDVQETCRRYATSARFGELARRFFGNYLVRLLGYFVDREVPEHIGPDRRFQSQRDVDRFQEDIKNACLEHADALEGYFRERAEIVRSFAGSYASLHNYHKDLELAAIRRRFIPQALRKLQQELVAAEGPTPQMGRRQ